MDRSAPWSNVRLKKRGRLTLGNVVAGCAALAAAWLAWSYYDSRYPSWEEEVQLSDGRVVVVRQKRQYFDHYGTNQSWVTFSLPEMGGERTWHSYLRPQRIDVQGGRVYLFGAPRGQRQFRYYRYPDVGEYMQLAAEFSRMDGGKPQTE
jgi:hypothetical protein